MRNWNEKMFFGAMPGRYDGIETWLEELRRHSIARIVCLAPASEISRRSPAYHLWRAQQSDYEVTDVPVPDYGVPEDDDAARFWSEAERVAREIGDGKRVFIHCGGGIGRTGTFAAAVLISMGYEPAQAIREVEPTGSSPETARQREFLGAR